MPGGEQAREVDDLVLRLVAGVGERVEVGGAEHAAALHHQPAGHRRVDAARQQQVGSPAGADGQAARSGDGLGEHERVLEADLDADGEIGVVDVHRQAGGDDDRAADVAAHVHRAHREALVGAARLDLEALRAAGRALAASTAASRSASRFVSHTVTGENDWTPNTRARRSAARSRSAGATSTIMRAWM